MALSLENGLFAKTLQIHPRILAKSPGFQALLDRALYPPEEFANDSARRTMATDCVGAMLNRSASCASPVGSNCSVSFAISVRNVKRPHIAFSIGACAAVVTRTEPTL